MVNYNPKVWFSLIFHSYSRHVLRTLLPALLFMGAFSALCCYLILDVFKLHENNFHSTTSMHSLLGIVLGLFLVFRTNSAYERWWEGRKLWGSMVNSTRNLALKLHAYLPAEDREERAWFARKVLTLMLFPGRMKDNVPRWREASTSPIRSFRGCSIA
jgi:putative membrane protein